MERKDQIANMQAEIDLLRAEICRLSSTLRAVLEQAKQLNGRADSADQNIKRNEDYMMGHFEKIDRDLDFMGDRLYPTYYKVFPGMIEMEEALERAGQQSKKPKG